MPFFSNLLDLEKLRVMLMSFFRRGGRGFAALSRGAKVV